MKEVNKGLIFCLNESWIPFEENPLPVLFLAEYHPHCLCLLKAWPVCVWGGFCVYLVCVWVQVGSWAIVPSLKALLEVTKLVWVGTMNTERERERERTRVVDIRSQFSPFVWQHRNSTLKVWTTIGGSFILTVGPQSIRAQHELPQLGVKVEWVVFYKFGPIVRVARTFP